jgi:hypothetical protein
MRPVAASAGLLGTGASLLVLAGCGDDGRTPLGAGANDPLSCSIPTSEIFNGGPGKDGIPALTDPETARYGEPGTEYLVDRDRVVGLVLEDRVIAIPLNIFWWHEIVNLDAGDGSVAVTHCPLTGSSMAFDRAVVGGAGFGVSGLLYQNNLILYDRNTRESLWPQMLRGARCGDLTGTKLAMVPVIEMTWGGWRALHPDTEVVTSNTAYDRSYWIYPYGNYDQPDNPNTLFPMGTLDRRRPPKERVLGIPDDAGGGVAVPFGSLAERGPVAAVETTGAGEPVVVFWNESLGGAMAYRPHAEGMSLTFAVEEDRIVDTETGSVWGVHGVAVEGPLAGRQIEPVPEAYVAFWFAWAAFHPETLLLDDQCDDQPCS